MNVVRTPLDRLERQIQTLRVEFARFLNGDSETPPEELRERIRRQIQVLHESARGVADRFRLTNLQARFRSYSELFNRQLREREQGRGTAARRQQAAGDDEEGR